MLSIKSQRDLIGYEERLLLNHPLHHHLARLYQPKALIMLRLGSFLLVACLGTSACQLAADIDLDTHYSVILEIVNGSAEPLHLDGIVSPPQVRRRFAILGQRLQPGEEFTTRTTQQTAAALRQQQFEVIALCLGQEDFWRRPGADVARVVADPDAPATTRLRVTIDACG